MILKHTPFDAESQATGATIDDVRTREGKKNPVGHFDGILVLRCDYSRTTHTLSLPTASEWSFTGTV